MQYTLDDKKKQLEHMRNVIECCTHCLDKYGKEPLQTRDACSICVLGLNYDSMCYPSTTITVCEDLIRSIEIEIAVEESL